MGRKNNETLDLVREAISQIKRGDTLDALTTLERCAFPKWGSARESEVAFWSSKPVEEIVAAMDKEAASAASGGEA